MNKDDVNRVIGENLDPKNVKIVAIVGNANKFVSEIEVDSATIVYPLLSSEIPSEQKEEDKAYSSFLLNLEVVLQRSAQGIFQ